MTTDRTGIGREIEAALGEVVAHVRGEAALSCRIVDAPAGEWIVALRKRLKLSRQRFADRFGLDVRAVQEWEQGRRVPDRAARVLLTVIDRDPESVVRALRGNRYRRDSGSGTVTPFRFGSGPHGAAASPIRYSFDCVRMNRLPWAMAGVAIVNSSSAFRPTTSNVPPARIT